VYLVGCGLVVFPLGLVCFCVSLVVLYVLWILCVVFDWCNAIFGLWCVMVFVLRVGCNRLGFVGLVCYGAWFA